MEENKKLESIAFSVDAGLINRLGMELVGRSETAVSELIKNAYDADSTIVEVLFHNTREIGGILRIEDNGDGMNQDDLVKGFMRLSSSDKIHNPISKKFKRQRAGKKGIGRFATQRLGEKLTIITKKEDMEKALKVVIDWSKYTIDTELTSIFNTIEEVEPIKGQGTVLVIEKLRDKWSDADIRRVYRYVSDLLQPNFLSDRSKKLNLAGNKENSFVAEFKYKEAGAAPVAIANPDKMIFDKAVAIIEGYVDSVGDGYYGVKSKKYNINEYAIPISSGNDKVDIEPFNVLKDVHFKAYYFIYKNDEYDLDFDAGFTKLEYHNFKKIAAETNGIKLYRNGFRVLPYGEKQDDWLDIDRKINSTGTAIDRINIPFTNKHLFGFVEVVDTDNKLFEETSSREGLIGNQAFEELKDFLHKSFKGASLKIASGDEFVKTKREKRQNAKNAKKESENEIGSIKDTINTLQQKISQNDPDAMDFVNVFLSELPSKLDKASDVLIKQINQQLNENAMLRILAGIGLAIGEFVHEIEQFDEIFEMTLNHIYGKTKEDYTKKEIIELKDSLSKYKVYTAYFRESISQNVKRSLRPLDLQIVINDFMDIIKKGKQKSIEINVPKFHDFDLITCPMHPSEWQAILFNLYTNSKKAIKRARVKGKILIEAFSVGDTIALRFSDNGDGISDEYKERIFEAFFTTSNPIDSSKLDLKDESGTGLGLKIIRDIVNGYDGVINIVPAPVGYSTCFEIIVPKNTTTKS